VSHPIAPWKRLVCPGKRYEGSGEEIVKRR
jgi:hypothetical protein